MVASRPILAIGSWGPDVFTVQLSLGVRPLDGDFGSVTNRAVEVFQDEENLEADGIVGPATWERLGELYDLPPYPVPLLPPLTDEQLSEVYDLVSASAVGKYSWRDRGASPSGYVKGMAVGFTTVLRKFVSRHSAALAMSEAVTTDKDHDALAWYADVFAKQGMDNSRSGLATLRHLWVLLWGLGMRESSGKYCCGRDMSATNVSADTAEAGLFQMSWNAHNASPHMQRLLDEYEQEGAIDQGAKDIFKEGVKCSQSDLSCYGSGTGVSYQRLAKLAPQFAAETCAVGLRVVRQHWGPINRKEVEVVPEVDSLLMELQELAVPTEV